MTRIIYSLYIDIPDNELDWQPPFYGEDEPKNSKAKRLFKDYENWIKQRHIEYAKACNIEYRLYEYDSDYIKYKKMFNEKYPMITSYNIVNFYKIHLLYKLAKQYDEILYIDFDVIPVSNKNFFDYWDLSNGVAILTNRKHIDTSYSGILSDKARLLKNPISNRSPTAKYWNARAMLVEANASGINDVYNTGIVGITAKQLNQLDYWGNFNSTLALMTELKNDEFSMYPEHIQRIFGWDNETIWSYKMSINKVEKQWLNEKWHHFMDKWNYVPKGTNLVHVINKEFGYVREWCEKNNL